jgi:thioredoxin-related protein
MDFMKQIFTTIALILFFSPALMAQEQKHGLTWYTSIDQAYELSQKAKKPVFAFFTGSDWCGWCHRLEAAVFEKTTFQEWARKNVILLELDFPRNTPQPEALQKQNAGLQQFFNVEGYPTIWLFNITKDKKSNKYNIAGLGSLGYPRAEQGKEDMAFLETANSILKKK